MCGIVAVVARRSRREPPDPTALLATLGAARADVAAAADDRDARVRLLGRAAQAVEAVDSALRGVPGIRALVADPLAAAALGDELVAVERFLANLEAVLDHDGGVREAGEQEDVNAALIRVKDAAWAVSRDRLRTGIAVADLMAGSSSPAAFEVFTAVQTALSAIDRLEVRGRDSAGVQVFVSGHGLDLDAPDVAPLVASRVADALLRSGAVRALGGALAFVYKAAAEIGELGDNVAALRRAITDDDLLHRALAATDASAVVLGHTRWASVGIISEANAHPLDQEEPGDRDAKPYVAAVLNGDVDNYGELVDVAGLHFPDEITTDAKVIPTLVSRRLAGGDPPEEAFRSTVASFEGSVAIAAHLADDPDRLFLALRGSGQALYIGLADDAFVVASEPYGLVEVANRYVRLDGDTPGNPENPGGSRGQVMVLDASAAGTLAGMSRVAYDGTPLAVTDEDVETAQITTRDIDRGPFPHYLLKELWDSPASFRKTLRGKILDGPDGLELRLGDTAIPAELQARLAAGSIRRVIVIGQGTAAVAGQSMAVALRNALRRGSSLSVVATTATELSGFELDDDMTDAVVVAISQSGTTTDTNRTVDLARSRGAAVLAIVNRRKSDLVDRSDGVLYTSDGRDVEMSVASTKAFYAQVAAGFLLAFALLRAADIDDGVYVREILGALRELPDALETVLASRNAIAQIAARHAPQRRSWAVVGNGANNIAAHEVRIKLSELCYKSIACDVTEDKKHIDLSSEPMILVCAAGLHGSNADDVGKELAIYRAHKAAAIAVVDAGAQRFYRAMEIIEVPPVHPDVAFVLSAMAGHLFGYEAALALDASARPLRACRAAVESLISDGAMTPTSDQVLAHLAREMEPHAARFFDGLREGVYDGALDARVAVRTASVLRYALEMVPLDYYELEHGRVGTPSTVIEDLTWALTECVDELTRPVDAIKHQAKTVTVGVSRSDESLLRAPLVREVLAAGAEREGLSYRVLRTLVDLDAAVEEVVGFTRYRIEGDPASENATIHVVDAGGLGAKLVSRTVDNPMLRGTKQIVAVEREVLVARGRSDGRSVLLVPETKHAHVVNVTLLHLRVREQVTPQLARSVLSGYRNRYAALRAAVTETEPELDTARLAEVPLLDLLTTPVTVLADRWRT